MDTNGTTALFGALVTAFSILTQVLTAVLAMRRATKAAKEAALAAVRAHLLNGTLAK